MDLIRTITRKWVQKAQSLASDENLQELNAAVGEYLSPKFTETRDKYRTELDKILSKDFSEKVIQNGLEKAKSSPAKQAILNRITTGFPIRILFSMDELTKKLRSLGVVNKVITKPAGNMSLTGLKDYSIIQWYQLKAKGIWNYYCCADNIWDLKKILNWILRYSLLGTLAAKYKSSIKRIIKKYTLAPKVEYTYEKSGEECTGVLARYMTSEEVNKLRKDFNNNSLEPIELESLLRTRINSLNSLNAMSHQCAIKDCLNNAEEIHHIRKLGRRLRGGFISASGQHRIQGWKGNISALKRKQVPLCKKCHSKMHSGKLSVDQLNSDYTFDIKGEV